MGDHFAPEQVEEIKRIVDHMVRGGTINVKWSTLPIESPPPPDAEKGDLSIAERINELRNEWADKRDGIRKMRGYDTPAARAYQDCVASLYDIQKMATYAPGQDLARARAAEEKLDTANLVAAAYLDQRIAAESKLAKVEASRDRWRCIVKRVRANDYVNCPQQVFLDDFTKALASDKEDSL